MGPLPTTAMVGVFDMVSPFRCGVAAAMRVGPALSERSNSVGTGHSVNGGGDLAHRAADEVVLTPHEDERVDLAELGECVALPFARPVAAVAALDEDAHEFRIVDRGLLPVLVDVVELGV